MTCSPDPIALLFRFELPFHAIRPLPQMISVLIPRFTSPGRRIRRIKTSVHRILKVLVLPPNRVPGQRSHRGGKHPQQRHSHNNVIFATTTGGGTAHLPHPTLRSLVLAHEEWSKALWAASRLKSPRTVMKQAPFWKQSQPGRRMDCR